MRNLQDTFEYFIYKTKLYYRLNGDQMSEWRDEYEILRNALITLEYFLMDFVNELIETKYKKNKNKNNSN